ncbi:MAG TPA: cytochrome c [Gammaproteobacteria bacterium]
MKPDHHAQRREHTEPEEGNFPVPRLLVVFIFGLVAWGAVYIGMQAGTPLAGGDSRTPVPMVASIDGGAIFNAQCAACHQGSGQGLPRVFPPLAGSEWVKADANIPIAIVNDGLQGAIAVNGAAYNGVMPAFGKQLSAEEMAAVLTFIRAEWGNGASDVKAGDVEQHRSMHAEHSAWTADELREAFGF